MLDPTPITRKPPRSHARPLVAACAVFLLLFSPCTSAQDVDFGWAAAMGGVKEDAGTATAVDASGNVYTTGYFLGTADFDPGPGVANLTGVADAYNFFVCKLDADGNYVWARQLAGASVGSGDGIALDALGNVYTTGNFAGTADFDPGAGVASLTSAGNDIFVFKLDADGNYVWARQLGGAGTDIAFALAVDASGNVYTTGYFSDVADFDPGAGTANLTSAGLEDIFVSKLDAAGNYVWAKNFSGISVESGSGIAVDASGNVYTTGYFYGEVDFDPGAGAASLTGAGGGTRDIFVSKLDAAGNYVWAKQLGGGDLDSGEDIALDASGGVYTTGYFSDVAEFDPGAGTANLTSAGAADIFVSKLDAAGNYVWAKRIGGTSYDIGLGLSLDASGKIYATGSFRGTVDFNPGAGVANLISAGAGEIFVSKLDAGNYVWAKKLGGADEDRANAIAVDASGSVYTTGYFEGTADFDPSDGEADRTSAGITELFVSKLILVDGINDKPSVVITFPTSATTYTTGVSPLILSGTAADDVGVTQVTWSNNRGGSGIAAGTTYWSVVNAVLLEGENVLVVTAHDADLQSKTDTLTVTFYPDLALALRDRFVELDADADGRLSAAESGIAGVEFNGVDPDPNDGYLTLAELLTLTVGPVGIATPVWVDFAWTSTENGQESAPFNTLDEAVAFVAPGGELKIEGQTAQAQTGEYALDKSMTLTATTGTVQIGATPARPVSSWEGLAPASPSSSSAETPPETFWRRLRTAFTGGETEP